MASVAGIAPAPGSISGAREGGAGTGPAKAGRRPKSGSQSTMRSPMPLRRPAEQPDRTSAAAAKAMMEAATRATSGSPLRGNPDVAVTKA